MYNLYMRKDGFTVISEVCGFYRKLLLVTWPCLHATRLRFLWKFWRIWCRLQPLSTSSECQYRFKMTSLVDSEAHLRKRADEMAMSERGVRAMIDKGITTLGKLAICTGVPIVSAEFDTFSQDVLGAMASIGDRAVFEAPAVRRSHLRDKPIKRTSDKSRSSTDTQNPTSREGCQNGRVKKKAARNSH